MKRTIFLSIIFSLFFVFNSWAGEINKVDFNKDELRIYLTEQTDWKILQQDDPFKLLIELKNTKPGILNKKMIFHEGIVSEISAKEVNTDTVVEILLSELSNSEIKFAQNILDISFSKKQLSQETPVNAKIIDFTVEKITDGYEVSIKADKVFPEPTVEWVNDYFNVSFSDVILSTELPKEIPVLVQRADDKLNLKFFLGKNFSVEPLYLGDEVVLEIKEKKEVKVINKEKAEDKLSVKTAYTNTPETDKTISLDLQDADIVGVFRLLGDVGGYNIVIHPDVKGKVTLKLINVSWLKALDIICKTYHLEKVFDGNIIRIAPVKVFQEEKKLQAETRELFEKAEDEQTKIYILKYASVDKVKATIESSKVLSPKGNISIDDRTRAIIVKDIPSVIAKVERLIAELDKPIKQILLETRIVEINSSFSKSLGFEWGISWRPPDSRSTIVGSQSGTTPVTGGNTPIGINLPASTPTAAFTVGYINASGTFALDLRISALQQSGKGKVISNPKVITLDNQKAKIVQGESIPYGEKDVQSGQISTKFKDVAITVEVTPHLVDEKTMLIDLNVVKEDLVEFVNVGGAYAPRTVKIEGNTKVSLRDGETLVIGGIYKQKDTFTTAQVPGLGDIPVVGELFKSRSKDATQYEVMIFITPRILLKE